MSSELAHHLSCDNQYRIATLLVSDTVNLPLLVEYQSKEALASPTLQTLRSWRTLISLSYMAYDLSQQEGASPKRPTRSASMHMHVNEIYLRVLTSGGRFVPRNDRAVVGKTLPLKPSVPHFNEITSFVKQPCGKPSNKVIYVQEFSEEKNP